MAGTAGNGVRGNSNNQAVGEVARARDLSAFSADCVHQTRSAVR